LHSGHCLRALKAIGETFGCGNLAAVLRSITALPPAVPSQRAAWRGAAGPSALCCAMHDRRAAEALRRAP